MVRKKYSRNKSIMRRKSRTKRRSQSIYRNKRVHRSRRRKRFRRTRRTRTRRAKTRRIKSNRRTRRQNFRKRRVNNRKRSRRNLYKGGVFDEPYGNPNKRNLEDESSSDPRPRSRIKRSRIKTNEQVRLGPHVDERNYQNCELKDDKYQSATDCCNEKFKASGKIPQGCYATTAKDQNGNDYKLLRAEKSWPKESDAPDYGAQREPDTFMGTYIPSAFKFT